MLWSMGFERFHAWKAGGLRHLLREGCTYFVSEVTLLTMVDTMVEEIGWSQWLVTMADTMVDIMFGTVVDHNG